MQHIISPADSDIRLDRWFKRHMPGLQHALLEKHLRKGDIRVDGKKAKSSDRIQAGQVIEVRCRMPDSKGQKKSDPSRITNHESQLFQKLLLHKDEHMLAINKPPGLAVQGGTGQRTSVDAMLDTLVFEAKERPKLVHRLDKDTSGVLLLARSAKAAAALSKGFAGKSIEKIYLALVMNVPKPREGVIDLPLSKGGLAGREKVGVDKEHGDRAITEYRVLEALAQKYALVELKPITGRTHQLRVHMLSIGCPIMGDGKYGGKDAFIPGMKSTEQLHLHARAVTLPPIFGSKSKTITAPLPEHMQETLNALGIYEFDDQR